jgi:hypothetical protein
MLIFTTNTNIGEEHMATIYLKDFPDQLHRESKSQAALMGVSMKELIIRALTEYLKTIKKKGIKQ